MDFIKSIKELSKYYPIEKVSDLAFRSFFIGPQSEEYNPYKSKVFECIFKFNETRSPVVNVGNNSVWHPNINYSTGAICVDVFHDSQWAAKYTFQDVLEKIIPSLLLQPNPNSPLNGEAAVQFEEWEGYWEIVSKHEKPISWETMQKKNLPEYFRNRCEENSVENPPEVPKKLAEEKKPEYMGEVQKHIPMLGFNFFDMMMERQMMFEERMLNQMNVAQQQNNQQAQQQNNEFFQRQQQREEDRMFVEYMMFDMFLPMNQIQQQLQQEANPLRQRFREQMEQRRQMRQRRMQPLTDEGAYEDLTFEVKQKIQQHLRDFLFHLRDVQYDVLQELWQQIGNSKVMPFWKFRQQFNQQNFGQQRNEIYDHWLWHVTEQEYHRLSEAIQKQLTYLEIHQQQIEVQQNSQRLEEERRREQLENEYWAHQQPHHLSPDIVLTAPQKMQDFMRIRGLIQNGPQHEPQVHLQLIQLVKKEEKRDLPQQQQQQNNTQNTQRVAGMPEIKDLGDDLGF